MVISHSDFPPNITYSAWWSLTLCCILTGRVYLWFVSLSSHQLIFYSEIFEIWCTEAFYFFFAFCILSLMSPNSFSLEPVIEHTSLPLRCILNFHRLDRLHQYIAHFQCTLFQSFVVLNQTTTNWNVHYWFNVDVVKEKGILMKNVLLASALQSWILWRHECHGSRMHWTLRKLMWYLCTPPTCSFKTAAWVHLWDKLKFSMLYQQISFMSYDSLLLHALDSSI